MENRILEAYNLSKTRGRQLILKVLAKNKFPVSGKEIVEQLQQSVDRATVYRTLNVFEKKQIVHKVLADNVWRYILSSSTSEDNSKEHVHFKCIRCCRLICLHEVEINDFELPEGYRKLNINVLITGICRDCTHKRLK